MKIFVSTLLFIATAISGYAQNIDSFLAIPQTLELKISTPQPRLKEKFQITLDANYVRVHIFKSALGKIQPANEIGDTNDGMMTLNVNALKKGKNEIGPLEFEINGTKYSTNKITYEVVDALPNVDKGLWFRKVVTSDSTFCIIIDQRIPANSKTTIISEKETKYSTEAINNNVARFKNSYSIDGLQGGDGSSYTDYSSIEDDKGEEKQFMRSYSITWFRIKDRKKKIVITKDKFQDLPAGYRFEDIVVQ